MFAFVLSEAAREDWNDCACLRSAIGMHAKQVRFFGNDLQGPAVTTNSVARRLSPVGLQADF